MGPFPHYMGDYGEDGARL